MRMVGPTKLPLGYLGTLTPRPSSCSLAPSSTPDWISASMRALAFLETTGPTSASGSWPALTTSFLARATNSGILRERASERGAD